MTDRGNLMRRIAVARTGMELADAVGALDAYDQGLQAQAAADRELGFASSVVERTFGIGPMHGDRHTADTDWLADIDVPRGLDFRVAMHSEAAAWMRSLPREVLGNQEEFTVQALGRARTAASAYGMHAQDAYNEFLAGIARQSAYMQRQGASGLPQIDQVIDGDNQMAPTPYPTEVFDNFQPEQNDYNGGVENPNHGSQISSRDAPMLQQIEQMDGRGSGYGSGPERADEHTESMDKSLGYAEVPLGPEGQIPTSVAGPGKMPAGGMQPPAHGQAAPVTNGGGPMDEADDQEKRGAHLTGSRYSRPDRLGFRWMIGPQPEAFHPYHQVCAASHWPDESCTPGMPHVASVAIDHSMTLAQAHHIGQCESYGLQEGLRALRQARGSFQTLAAHHNRLASAWAASGRSVEDTAVLRGFQAVVRPVLAEAKDADDRKQDDEDAHETQIKIKIPGKKAMRVTASQLQAWGRDISQKKREQLKARGDTLPGTTKLPVETAGDLKNAEELKGKVKGASPAKIDAYLERKRKQLGKAASKKSAKRKNKKKGVPQKKKDKGGAFPGAAAPFGKQGDLRYANGNPMGDTRPAETMPTGEVVGDADHDYWDYGEIRGGPDYGGHRGGESGQQRVVGSRPNFTRA